MTDSKPRLLSDSIRKHVRDRYVSPARQRRESTIEINVGVVHKDMGFNNRVPLVCQALRSRKFLEMNGLRLVSETGPQSGLSTTVTLTYEWTDMKDSNRPDPWLRLRGMLKGIFTDLGGGEAYLRAERDAFYGSSSPSGERR